MGTLDKKSVKEIWNENVIGLNSGIVNGKPETFTLLSEETFFNDICNLIPQQDNTIFSVGHIWKDKQGEVICEGNVDEVCKQFGKWSAYKSSDKKYQVTIKEI